MRVGVLILPIESWDAAGRIWRTAEDWGFDSAWTYDLLSYDSFRERPWFAAHPTLSAAAAVTARIRLGTLVTNTDLRHPVALSKEVITLDDISGGRFTLGLGAGSQGFDVTAFGNPPRPPHERADRFAEFVELTDLLLTGSGTTYAGRYYSAGDVRMVPGCVQRPRVPFAVAARGPRGMRLAARYGEAWVVCPRGGISADEAGQVVLGQCKELRRICEAESREFDGLARILLTGYTAERPRDSVDAFVDCAGRYAELGITDLIIHYPVPDSRFASDLRVFEEIARNGLPQVRDL